MWQEFNFNAFYTMKPINLSPLSLILKETQKNQQSLKYTEMILHSKPDLKTTWWHNRGQDTRGLSRTLSIFSFTFLKENTSVTKQM